MHELAEKYLRKEALPLLFCPGCGNGQVLNATVRAIDELKVRDDLAAVSGIGCSSWIPVYLDIDVLHTLHGRALAYAQGLKLSRPDKKVIVFTGDGDCGGIGGNHLIHAARRNIDITVVMINNYIYGMTGGQKAPTTPYRSKTKTSPYGNDENPFDVSKVVMAAGGTYVARWTTNQPVQIQKSIQKAITHKGFSFLEIMTQCPVQTGKYIFKNQDPWETMQWYKDRSATKAEDIEKGSDQFLLGEFVEDVEEEFCERIARERDGLC